MTEDPRDEVTEYEVDGHVDTDVVDHGPIFGGHSSHRAGHRASRRRGRGMASCLVVLAIFAAIGVGGYFGATAGIDKLKELVAETPDYDGPGSGEVTVEVKEGDTATDIGRTLHDAGVVKSVEAFYEAAIADDRSLGIQVGFYPLAAEMKATDALEILVDPANLILSRVAIPEGYTLKQIVAKIAADTEWPIEDVQAALDDTAALGLPEYADGNPEGYLFPATYSLTPTDTPASLLGKMVARWSEAAADADLEGRADELGYTPAQVMTIASLIEAEGRGDDMPKIARVIYNRLETPGAPTYGKLEIDATVNYAIGRDDLGVALSSADLAVDSPYNTRKYAGLPPGPIEAPGDDAIQAALNPAEGDWYFYVTVNLATGETKFAKEYNDFLAYKREYQEYCKTSDAC